MRLESDPLVTIALATYNQESYVRAAVRGVLEQGYKHLKIIISDDCSQDGTWEAVQDELSDYRAKGGGHKNIVLNRNKSNLGIARHCQQILSMCEGDLVFFCAGDDISYTNRVECIVEAWLANDRKSTVILHGFDKIDLTGKHIVCERPWRVETPLGAAAVYSLSALRNFPPVNVTGSFEDHVYSVRALCNGSCLYVDKPLVQYRVGSGVTSQSGFRTNRKRVAQGALLSAQQSEMDLMFVNGKIGDAVLGKAWGVVAWRRNHYMAELKTVDGRFFWNRWRGYFQMSSESGWDFYPHVKFYLYFPQVLRFGVGTVVVQIFKKLLVIRNRLSQMNVLRAICGKKIIERNAK